MNFNFFECTLYFNSIEFNNSSDKQASYLARFQVFTTIAMYGGRGWIVPLVWRSDRLGDRRKFRHLLKRDLREAEERAGTSSDPTEHFPKAHLMECCQWDGLRESSESGCFLGA